jgi:hypothetical protein
MTARSLFTVGALVAAAAWVPALAESGSAGAKDSQSASGARGSQGSAATGTIGGMEGAMSTTAEGGASVSEASPAKQGESSAGEKEGVSAEKQAAGSGEMKQQAEGSGAMKSVVGTVEKMTADTLTLRNRLDETHDFKVDDQTKFTQGGRSIEREQISEGQEVRAVFRSEGDALHATEIRVQRGSQQGAPGGAEKPAGQEASGSAGSDSPQGTGTSPQGTAPSPQGGASSSGPGGPQQ